MHISVTLRICPGTLSSKVTDRDCVIETKKKREVSTSSGDLPRYVLAYDICLLYFGAFFGGYFPAFSVSERCPGNIVEKTWAR